VASKADLKVLCLDGAPFPTKAVTYNQANDDETQRWIRTFEHIKPVRVLIMDFGGRGDSLERLHAMFMDLGMQVRTLAVGFEAKLYSPEELAQFQGQFKRLDKIQSNASGQRQAARAPAWRREIFLRDVCRMGEVQETRRLPWYGIKMGQGYDWRGWDRRVVEKAV
jgi:hypothetical protein